MSYHVLNIKINQHRRPQSKSKPPPVHSNHSPTNCGQPELCGCRSRPWGFNHPLSRLVVSPAKMKTCVYCFFFGQTVNIYAMHYQTKITMYFVPGIMAFFSYWSEAVPRRDCSWCKHRARATHLPWQLSKCKRGISKFRKINAVVESHTPHKQKCHLRQQEILLPQQCRKSRRVANPFMLILDQVSFFALKQHKKYLVAHILVLINLPLTRMCTVSTAE